MKYLKKKLTIENVKVDLIAKKYGTPAYCYSYSKLKRNIENFKKSFQSFSPLICFAVKSNTNMDLIREIKKFGLGADVVSMGELMMAIKAGINPKKIVFSGVGKTIEEIHYAINKNILLINAESESEIKLIERIAKLKRKKVEIGIRLNPNTDAKTLRQISTGKKDNKFGVNSSTFIKLVNNYKNSNHIKLKCLSVHIGSQILDHKPYEDMLKSIIRILKKINYKFEFIDLGGGMGISYNDQERKLNYQKYCIAINKFLNKYNSKIIFEPGRSIIGNTGTLVSKIIYIKKSEKKNFIILDAAMNDLMRPALYGAVHRIMPTLKKPICESTDSFLNLKKFQELKENEIIVICDVGAYGMSLGSNYNLRPRPIELMIRGSKIKVIKKRQKYIDFI